MGVYNIDEYMYRCIHLYVHTHAHIYTHMYKYIHIESYIYIERYTYTPPHTLFMVIIFVRMLKLQSMNNIYYVNHILKISLDLRLRADCLVFFAAPDLAFGGVTPLLPSFKFII